MERSAQHTRSTFSDEDLPGAIARGPLGAILRQIESLGFKVSQFHINDMVEMHAVLLADPDQQFIARCGGWGRKSETYRCACVLAEMVGIDLHD